MSRPYPLATAPDHDLHDPLLVAQFAAGDPLEADEYGKAQLWAGTCGACAQLAADLRAVSGAVAWEPTPPRRRDLRLTPERADQLRGSPFSRLLRRLALPQSAMLRPAAAGVMSIGLLLVVAGTAWESTETVVQLAEPAAVPAAGTQDQLELRSELRVLPDATAPAVGLELTVPDPERAFAETVDPDGAARNDTVESEVFRAYEAPDAAAADEPQANAPAAATGSSADDAVPADAAAAPGSDGRALDAAGAELAGALEVGQESEDDAHARNAKVLDGTESVLEAPLERAAPTLGFFDLGAVTEADRQAIEAERSEGLAAGDVVAPSDEPGLESIAVAVGLLMAVAGAVLLLLLWLARRRMDPLLR